MASSRRMNAHLKKTQIKELKSIIIAERERIQNKLNLEKPHLAVNESNSGRDEVDSANDDIMRHTELRFATRETLYLKKIIKTLHHMDTDEYGMCEECGGEISFTRLRARPTSTMCISCKEESEREEMQSSHGRVSKSLGKSVSFT
ncbi:MAG: RNA polymerase-binding protein DksA [Halobacteriovoraceae bacterium]|nr:RNA polymerase-binding protein DksA [Halobacteriovoraceae bacterium]|tara:strand:- start:29642 stop:30079 length:438 start_codon:yes stop_codon:yes gene_type:complete